MGAVGDCCGTEVCLCYCKVLVPYVGSDGLEWTAAGLLKVEYVWCAWVVYAD